MPKGKATATTTTPTTAGKKRAAEPIPTSDEILLSLDSMGVMELKKFSAALTKEGFPIKQDGKNGPHGERSRA